MRIQGNNFGARPAVQYQIHNWQYIISKHIHQYAELIIMLEGETRLTVDGTSQILCAGDAAFIFPFQTHSIFSSQKNKLAMYLFSPAVMSSFTKEHEGMVGERAKFTPSEATMAVFKEKILEKKDIQVYPLRGFLYLILDDYLSQNKLREGLEGTNIVARIIPYINRHFNEPITLETVAAELGYSKNYLSHCIKRLYGLNFCQTLAIVRIEHARTLLLTTDKSISEICFECGFGSEQSFFRHFKEKTKLSPNELRKNYKAAKDYVPTTIYYD